MDYNEDEVMHMNTSIGSIEALADIFRSGQSMVFFGGAGTSTESDIPDFRSANGLYSTNYHGKDPEYLLSHECLFNEPEIFYDYLKTNLHYPKALPNKTHRVLFELEQLGNLKAVITQNIDGLHQAAGSRNVLELHGSMKRAYCMKCKTEYPGDALFSSLLPVPRCTRCNGMLRPDVTLYGEALNYSIIEAAVAALSHSHVLIVGGTSLAVQPAASFLAHFKGKTLVLMNRDATPIDRKASLIIREPMGSAMGQAYGLAFGKIL